ncbi:hypothetical protein ACIF8W_19555 [Streptomyces sp. NPDC085639]|uniref:hypothetical protein n=1 Tax=Streptomyces sp. NPDC085639 TaxID=3365734 RepID=UPI0037D38945
MAKALTTASISEAAMHTHRALVAEVAFPRYPKARRSSGRPTPSYDSTTAAAVLEAKPVDTGRLVQAPAIFGALLDAGPLTFRQAAQLYNLTFKRPGRMQSMCVPLWLRHAGPTALPRLLALMTPHLGDYGIGEDYSEGLARLGRHALPALPSLAALIERRTRLPVNDSTRDGETMLDERLLAAAINARRAILAAAVAGGNSVGAGCAGRYRPSGPPPSRTGAARPGAARPGPLRPGPIRPAPPAGPLRE